MRLVDHLHGAVPSGTVQEQTLHIGTWHTHTGRITRQQSQLSLTIHGILIVSLVVEHFIIEVQQVNRDRVFPGIVLLHTREKGLGEIEARDPENWRRPIIEPILIKLDYFN